MASNVLEATTLLDKQAKHTDDDLTSRNEVENEVSKKAESKSSTKKSSRFFPASYFSTDDDSTEFTPSTAFSEFATVVKAHVGKVVVGAALLLAG